jgi:hypothetical protein
VLSDGVNDTQHFDGGLTLYDATISYHGNAQ